MRIHRLKRFGTSGGTGSYRADRPRSASEIHDSPARPMGKETRRRLRCKRQKKSATCPPSRSVTVLRCPFLHVYSFSMADGNAIFLFPNTVKSPRKRMRGDCSFTAPQTPLRRGFSAICTTEQPESARRASRSAYMRCRSFCRRRGTTARRMRSTEANCRTAQ